MCSFSLRHLVFLGSHPLTVNPAPGTHKTIRQRTNMSHYTTIRAVLRRVGVRVRRVDIKHDPVGAGFTATVDVASVQEWELIQRLALACRGEW